MARSRLFCVLWQDPDIRETLFSFLSKTDISNVRLVNIACSGAVTRRLFKRTHVTFRPVSFTKASRIRALCRIGKYIEHLTFSFPHSSMTFLPPVIHPQTGQEISFLYTPHTSTLACVSRPKYTSAEIADILLQQYPPLFHAATNVPSFVAALSLLTNLRHLTISCPGQEPQERYRRGIVDYALISLRIALEKAPLKKLHKLSLSSVHPAAFIYLRHMPGFGSSPAAARRWQQINNLRITVDSWDFSGPAPGVDHLKMLQDYMRSFSGTLEKLSFGWSGSFKGPCPLYLSADPLFVASSFPTGKRLFKEITSPMSPLPPLPASDANGPLKMPKLRYMEICNTTMSGAQIRSIIDQHKNTVRDFDFESVTLTNNDSWEDAMQPLRRSSNSSRSYWSERSSLAMGDSASMREEYLARDDMAQPPSAAVEAAAQQLLRATLGRDGRRPSVDLGNTFTTHLSKKKASVSQKARGKHGCEPRRKEKDAHTKHGRAPTSPALSSGSKASSKRSGADSLFSDMVDVLKPRPLRLPGSGKSHHRTPTSPPPPTPESHGPTPPLFDALNPHEPVTPPHTPPSSPKAALKAAFKSPPRLRSPLSRAATTTTSTSTSTTSRSALPPTPPQTPPTQHLDVSPVQRNLAQEEAHRRLAQDPALRTAALQRAREAVLANMARSYNNGGTTSTTTTTSSNSQPQARVQAARGRVQRAAASEDHCARSFAMGAAVRRELFSETQATVSVISDGGLLESQTALVPLIIRP